MVRFLRLAVPFCAAAAIAAGSGRLAAQGGFSAAGLSAQGAGQQGTSPVPDPLRAVREEIVLHRKPVVAEKEDSAVPLAIEKIKARSAKQLGELASALREKTRLSEILLRQMKEGKINADLAEAERFPLDWRQSILFQTKEIKEEDVAFVSESIKRNKTNLTEALGHKRALIPLIEWPFEIGEVGRLRKGTVFKIIQVIDEHNALCKISYEHPAPIWVSGFSTVGLTDGALIDPGYSVLEMVGTKSYANGFGAQQTVEHLRRVDAAETLKLMAELNGAKP
jgi:hypothetical protein